MRRLWMCFVVILLQGTALGDLGCEEYARKLDEELAASGYYQPGLSARQRERIADAVCKHDPKLIDAGAGVEVLAWQSDRSMSIYDAYASWMNSPPHRQAIESGAITCVICVGGVAVGRGPSAVPVTAVPTVQGDCENGQCDKSRAIRPTRPAPVQPVVPLLDRSRNRKISPLWRRPFAA